MSLLPGTEKLGLTLAEVSRQVRQAYYGEEVQRLPRENGDVTLRVERVGVLKGRLEAHRDELDRHVIAMESDAGSFAPRGFTVDADSLVITDLAARCEPLARLVVPESPEHWKVRRGGSGPDIAPLAREGVVGVGHRVDGTRYFDYHHSGADTFDKIDPVDLARNVAAIAGFAWVVAEPTARPGESPAGGLR